MRTSSFIAALLLFAGTVLAEPSGKAPSSELSQLRENYIKSLKQLLQRSTEHNAFGDAAAACQELDRVIPASRKTAVSKSAVGEWQWADGSTTTTLDADGTATNVQNTGVWHWIGESRRKLQIQWKDGVVDTLTVASDGKTMLAVNSRDEEFVAHRLAAAKKAEVTRGE